MTTWEQHGATKDSNGHPFEDRETSQKKLLQLTRKGISRSIVVQVDRSPIYTVLVVSKNGMAAIIFTSFHIHYYSVEEVSLLEGAKGIVVEYCGKCFEEHGGFEELGNIPYQALLGQCFPAQVYLPRTLAIHFDVHQEKHSRPRQLGPTCLGELESTEENGHFLGNLKEIYFDLRAPQEMANS
ncbi:hypothetical protein C8R42DRAFT_713367 [Lentinula raphanica]|nr:hypothetical protein C8R42DRAFT_713367 [Lentinula raphanica]